MILHLLCTNHRPSKAHSNHNNSLLNSLLIITALASVNYTCLGQTHQHKNKKTNSPELIEYQNTEQNSDMNQALQEEWIIDTETSQFYYPEDIIDGFFRITLVIPPAQSLDVETNDPPQTENTPGDNILLEVIINPSQMLDIETNDPPQTENTPGDNIYIERIEKQSLLIVTSHNMKIVISTQ